MISPGARPELRRRLVEALGGEAGGAAERQQQLRPRLPGEIEEAHWILSSAGSRDGPRFDLSSNIRPTGGEPSFPWLQPETSPRLGQLPRCMAAKPAISAGGGSGSGFRGSTRPSSTASRAAIRRRGGWPPGRRCGRRVADGCRSPATVYHPITTPRITTTLPITMTIAPAKVTRRLRQAARSAARSAPPRPGCGRRACGTARSCAP